MKQALPPRIDDVLFRLRDSFLEHVTYQHLSGIDGFGYMNMVTIAVCGMVVVKNHYGEDVIILVHTQIVVFAVACEGVFIQ